MENKSEYCKSKVAKNICFQSSNYRVTITRFIYAAVFYLMMHKLFRFRISAKIYFVFHFHMLFSTNVVVWDGQYGYQNLFDATLDAVLVAIDNTGIGYVEVVVSESG